MIDKKEIGFIALAIIIISVSVTLGLNLTENLKNFFVILLSVSLVILLNLFIKKIVAYTLDAKIETKLWDIKLPKRGSGKYKRFSAGAFFPLLSRIIFFPFNSFVWMACLVFDVTPRIYRGAKRYGLYTFSDITED